MIRWRLTLFSALSLGAFGCGSNDLPGHYWDLTLSTDIDNCNADSVPYEEELSYRLDFDDALGTVEVAVGPDVFATGSVSGCQVDYASIIWNEIRPSGDIQWRLTGTATAQRGDGACGIPSDWIGQEEFRVISSEDPEVSPDCTYTVDIAGSYNGEVGE